MSIWKEVKELAAEYVPDIAASLVPPPGGGLARRLVAGVLGIKDDDPQAMADALRSATPEQRLALVREANRNREALLKEANRHAEAMAGEDTARIGSVNKTMQTEAQAPPDSWAARWRPFWGFVSGGAFGLAVIGLLIIIGRAVWRGQLDIIEAVPGIISALAMLFSIPGAILGVASWHRGQMQRVQAGEQKSGLVGLVRAIKG